MTFFEQIPVETVKKIFEERNQRTTERTNSDDPTVQQPVTQGDSPTANHLSRSTNSASPERVSVTDESSDDLKYPEWQKPIQAALLEFDPQQLPARIATAEAAISSRLGLLSKMPNSVDERLAIQDGLRLLAFLKERPVRTA